MTLPNRMTPILALSIAAFLPPAGCNPPADGYEDSSGTVDPQGGKLVISDKPRDKSPDVAPADSAALVAGNTAFALDLYQSIRAEEGNLFCSPYSITSVLALAYAGAEQQTAQEMADTLHFTLPQDRLHPALNLLDLTMAGRAADSTDPDSDGFHLNIVNALWGQDGFNFRFDFLDVLAVNYGAGLRALDFAASPGNARVTINAWVSSKTNDRITDLIPPGSISTTTKVVLTNVIYFKAAWQLPFDEDYTSSGPFTLLDGTQVDASMMTQVANYNYAEGDGYQAIELPYAPAGQSATAQDNPAPELSMVVLLPDAARFQTFEQALTADQLAGIIGSLAEREVALTMPKFTFDWNTSLTQTLSGLGMPSAFQGGIADFSGIGGVPGDLRIGDVVHSAFVSVDEIGTEAAAATAVIQPGTGPEPPIDVTLDRPFLFLIRDIPTGTILFLGRLTNPAS